MASFNLVAFTQGLYRRSPPWFISGAICAMLLASSQVIYYAAKGRVESDSGTAVKLGATKEALEEVVQPPETIDRKAVPENEEVEVVDFEHDTDVFVPTSDEDLTLEHGDPNATENLPGGTTGGTAIGVGDAPGHFGTGKASPFGGRRLGGGMNKGRGGPTQGTEKAIREGMLWLCRHQLEDGHWSAEALSEICLADSRCTKPEDTYNDFYDEGVTGLALLAFLGAGYNFDNKQFLVDTVRARKHRIGEVVKNGLMWFKDRQRDDGSFSERQQVYNQALAALALCEAYGLSQSRIWKEPAQRSIDWLVKAQKPNPNGQGLWGWRYWSRQDIERHSGDLATEDYSAELYDADTSATTWVVMALKSAELSGLVVPQETYEGALAFAKAMTGQNGLVGYLSADQAGMPVTGGKNDHYQYHVAVMSSLGMLCRTFIEKNLEDPFLEQASKVLIKDLPTVSKDNLSIDYYYWYYGSLALNQYDGPDSPHKGDKYWGPWNQAMNEAVLGLQNETEKSCTRGGWIEPDRWTYHGGPIYTTAINILTLEVYYRYENAFGAFHREKAKPKSGPK